jgi:O-antigen/teichoic acid export membrane protein
MRRREYDNNKTPSDLVGIELRRLMRQSGHYVAGLLGVLALGFVSFPVFTRIFSVADYGMIDYVQKVILLLTAGAKFGLQQSALRFYDGRRFSSDPIAARRYYSTTFFSVGVAASAVTGLFVMTLCLAPHWLIEAPLAGLLCFAGTLVFLRAMESLLWVFLRVEEHTKMYSVANVAMKAATIAAVCLLLAFGGRSPRTYFAGAIVVEGVTVAVLTVWLFRRGLIEIAGFNWPLAQKSLAFGAPLVMYELAGVTLDSGDRLLVRHYLGAQPLGLYSVAYGLSSYINEVLIVPLNLALVPLYMRLWKNEGSAKTREFLNSALDIFSMVAIGVFAAACALSRDGILLLASSKYRGAEALMPMVVAGLLLYASNAFFSSGLWIHNQTMTMAKVLVWSATVNIGLNVLLLPRMGLQAAALATLLSYALCTVLLWRASAPKLPLRVDGGAIAKYFLAAGAAWAGASRIELGTPLLNLLTRGTTVVLIYSGLLWVIDQRMRALFASLVARLAQHSDAAQVDTRSLERQKLFP